MRLKNMAFVCGVLVVLGLTMAVQAKTISIPNFATNPSGTDFVIEAIAPGEGLTHNIATASQLEYGQTSVPDGTSSCLRMAWQAVDPYEEATAGWRLRFLADPDIRNHVLSFSVNAPGGFDPQGNFVGVTNVTVGITDINNQFVGGWQFNTDQLGAAGPVVNDPLAQNKISLYNNIMQTITINLLLGPTPGSAIVAGGPGAPRIAPNLVIAGNNNLAQAATLDYYENGLLRGSIGIPGQPFQGGLVNFWDHVSLVPEPATLALLALGGLAVTAIRRRK